jgi:molecular chaperone GrpE (heat shock protein)
VEMGEFNEATGTADAPEEEASEVPGGQDLDAGHEGEGARIEGGQAPVADAQASAEGGWAAAEGGGGTAEVGGSSSDDAPNEPVADDEAPGTGDGAGLEALATAFTGLDRRLEESQRLLVRQSELADKLHGENQRLRAGELRGAMLPLVRDLLRLHDDIGRIADATEQVEDLELMQISLLDALSRNGIVSVRPAEGEQFDPKRHSAASVVEAADASLDRSISEVIRLGFQWEDGQVIRVADVRVYKHTPPSGPSSSDTEATPDAEADPETRANQDTKAGAAHD